MRIPGHLARAEIARFLLHHVAGMLRGGDEIDLVLLDNPAAEKARVVRFQVARGRKGLDLSQQLSGHAARSRHEFVVKKMIE